MEGRDMQVRGNADRTLLANLDQLLAIWSAWQPRRMTHISIVADREESWQPPGTDAVCCFSGGADACYTVWRHTLAGRLHPEALRAGIFVQGFDVGIDDAGGREALESAGRILDSAGIECIPVATNFRSVVPDWELTFGAAACSVLTIFSPRFGRGLLAGGGECFVFSPWGSTPMTDHLLSTSRMTVSCDGVAISRSRKIQEIAKWPEARRELRVCWEQRGVAGKNCGRCEKCLRTHLCFLASGETNIGAFAAPPSITDIEAMTFIPPRVIDKHEEILELARANGLSQADWAVALAARVRRGRLELSPHSSHRVMGKMLKIPGYLRRRLRRIL